MSLAADVAAYLPEFRRQAESLMTSAGVIKRANGGTVTDPVTLIESPTYDTIFTGPARLRMSGGGPGSANVLGQSVATDSAILSLPVEGSGIVRTGDLWECTENPLDDSLVGRVMRITGVHVQTYATARRFTVEETS